MLTRLDFCREIFRAKLPNASSTNIFSILTSNEIKSLGITYLSDHICLQCSRAVGLNLAFSKKKIESRAIGPTYKISNFFFNWKSVFTDIGKCVEKSLIYGRASTKCAWIDKVAALRCFSIVFMLNTVRAGGLFTAREIIYDHFIPWK